jgi:hypothetical protein
MAEGEVYGFEAGTVERIRDAVRGFEEMALIPGAELENRFPSDVPSVEIVRVTSTTKINGEYPGKLQLVNPLPTPPTYTDGIDCWVVGPNGETLSAQRYLARADGDGNTPKRPRFIVSLSASGGGSGVPAVTMGLIRLNVPVTIPTGFGTGTVIIFDTVVINKPSSGPTFFPLINGVLRIPEDGFYIFGANLIFKSAQGVANTNATMLAQIENTSGTIVSQATGTIQYDDATILGDPTRPIGSLSLTGVAAANAGTTWQVRAAQSSGANLVVGEDGNQGSSFWAIKIAGWSVGTT